jgi:hypothetical protein
MLNRMAIGYLTGHLRSALLIGSTLALLGGTGIASAQTRDQVVDNPPGTRFQTQGVREEQGRRAQPTWSRTARMPGYRSYAYAPRIVVRHHRFIRHNRWYD